MPVFLFKGYNSDHKNTALTIKWVGTPDLWPRLQSTHLLHSTGITARSQFFLIWQRRRVSMLNPNTLWDQSFTPTFLKQKSQKYFLADGVTFKRQRVSNICTGKFSWNEEEQTCWRMMEKLHVLPAWSLELISFCLSIYSIYFYFFPSGFYYLSFWPATDFHRYMHTGALACHLIKASLKTSSELHINSIWTKKPLFSLIPCTFTGDGKIQPSPPTISFTLSARENAFRQKTMTLIYHCPHRFLLANAKCTHSEFF